MVETHPEKRLIGYARVSTYGQTLDSQLEQLRAAGCTTRNIYREKVTGAHSDRRELNKMVGKLAPGDVVTVTRIDRLARSTFDLFGIVKRIVDAKAQFQSLAEPWADTGTSTGRLVLAVLGGLADVERDLIRTRTAEGRSRAKAQGKHMGRPPSLTPAQQCRAETPSLHARARRRLCLGTHRLPHARAMPGSPLKRQRKLGAVDPITGEPVPFPRLTHPRAGLHISQWRALSPGEKIERQLGMSLARCYEILSWPHDRLDPVQLGVQMQVGRVVMMIASAALFPRLRLSPAAREFKNAYFRSRG
jgi:DNA invertase Pin-like site-specific DNA recombinase